MGLSLLGLKNMDTETMVIERFDTAIFFMVLTQHKLHTSSHSRKHSDTTGRGYGNIAEQTKTQDSSVQPPTGIHRKVNIIIQQ